MPNEKSKTNHGIVPKLSEENNSVWMDNIHQVHIAKKTYNNVNNIQLLSVGNGIPLSPQQDTWLDLANKVIALI